jgi:hypothetical protein
MSEIADELRRVTEERDRLQRIIDSRPAINAGLPETYIAWSRSIYALDIANASETMQ